MSLAVAEPRKNAVARQPPWVIVIDDDESMREGCRQVLTEQGYRTVVAEDGKRGLQIAEQVKPDVALVDLKMPGLGGMAVLEGLHRIDSCITPVVITGYGTIESAVQAMDLGAADYIAKPFDDEQLIAVVSRAVERHQQDQKTLVLERDKELTLENYAAVVCHQLRSPVAAAAQWLDVLGSGLPGELNQQQKSMVDRGRHRLQGLLDTIQGWLRVASLDADNCGIRYQRAELPAIIYEAWDTVSDGADHDRVSLQMAVGEDVLPVRGDHQLLCELFATLFSNAIKHTPGKGIVRVGLAASGPSIVVRVADWGSGIPSEELPHIFEPFFRGHGGKGHRSRGTGLGLAIARRITELHHGEITVSSVMDKGTTFTVTLPSHYASGNEPSRNSGRDAR